MEPFETKRHASPAGLVPIEWHLQRMDRVANVSYGISDPLNRSLTSGIPMIAMPNVTKDGRLLINDIPFVEKQKVKTSVLLKKGDLLFNWRNGSIDHLGKTAFFDLDGEYTHVGFLLKIRPKTINPKYLDCYMKFIKDRGYFKKAKIQVNNTFNKEELNDLPVVVPSTKEQEKMSAIFSQWDYTINLTESLIAAKQKRRTWLMQQLLTGKRRLPGFDGEWREVHLRDIFERVQRSIPDGENPEVLSITAKVGFVSQREKFSKVIAGKNLEQYVLIRKGEFSYNKGNSLTYPQGCVFRLKEFEEGAVPNVFLSFRAASSEVYPDFYSHFFASGGLNHQLSRVINTGVRNDGLLNLNASDFFNVKAPFPSVAEQEQIAKTLTLANAELDLLRSQLDAMREQKKGLMQQLLTGKIRVFNE